MSALVSRKPSAKSSPRGQVAGRVGRRVDQQLHCRHRAAAGPGQQADHGGEVAAGAVAADRDPGRVDAQLGGVGAGPGEGGPGVLDRGREGMLGRQPVVDREHRRPGRGGEEAADAVVGVEVADHPAAAVEVDRAAAAACRARGRRERRAGPGSARPGRAISSPSTRAIGIGGCAPVTLASARACARAFSTLMPSRRTCSRSARRAGAARGCRWPASARRCVGGAPNSRRCTRGEQPAGPLDDAVLGGWGEAREDGHRRCQAMPIATAGEDEGESSRSPTLDRE